MQLESQGREFRRLERRANCTGNVLRSVLGALITACVLSACSLIVEDPGMGLL